MNYLRLIAILLWLVLGSFAGLAMCLAPWRWGDLDLDHDIARLISWGWRRFARLEVQVEGREHLEAHQPCIYVGNHQTGLDLATFGQIYPHKTIVIGKKELIWIPIFGLAFLASGNIMVNRQNRSKAIQSLSKAVQAIKDKGASVFIYPEGTRNRSGVGLLPFKRGAFHMAIEAGIPIVPIVCSSMNGLADLKLRGGRVVLRILPPIPTMGLKATDAPELSAKVYEIMSEALRGLSTP